MTQEQIKNLKEWIAALRSGDYQQARGKMVTKWTGENCFCCIGVAGMLDKEMVPSILNPFEKRYNGLTIVGLPPEEWFNKRYGLPEKSMYVLAEMNDSSYKTFDEIAEFLEEFLPKEETYVS